MKSNINNSKQSSNLNNHNRQRVIKTQGDRQTNYLWQQGLLDAEITDGQISRRYLYLGLRPIAIIDYDQNNKASIYSIHTDYLGTPKQITDQAKQVVWTAEYDDFGQITSKQAKDNFEFNLRFAGQYEDSESGYYYNWHRYYNPATGRYLTSDPIGLAGGLNTYVYANQSPSMGVDPWGLKPDYMLFDINKDANMRRYTSNIPYLEDTFQIAGHGNNLIIRDVQNGKKVSGEKGKINSAMRFDQRFEHDPEWELAKRLEDYTVILYACSTGRTTSKEKSIAQKISLAYPNLTVIAPTRQTWWNDQGFSGVYGKDSSGNKDTTKLGYWISYQSGKAVTAYDSTWQPGDYTWFHKVDLADIPKEDFNGSIGKEK